MMNSKFFPMSVDGCKAGEFMMSLQDAGYKNNTTGRLDKMEFFWKKEISKTGFYKGVTVVWFSE